LHTVTLADGAWACGRSKAEVFAMVERDGRAEITVVRRDGAREDFNATDFQFAVHDALVILGTQSGVIAAELGLTR
jgi:hypothetical protein